MKADQIRSMRLRSLLQLALTGKYTWDQLRNHCIANWGTTRQTANSYIEAVENKLRLMGKIN